jgi:hypothetical protein
MEPSGFTAASVECINGTNGAVSDYLFYFTLDVVTPVGSFINVSLPQEIKLF